MPTILYSIYTHKKLQQSQEGNLKPKLKKKYVVDMNIKSIRIDYARTL